MRRQAITMHVANTVAPVTGHPMQLGQSDRERVYPRFQAFDQEYTALMCWVLDNPTVPVPMELAQRLETLRIAGNHLLITS